MRLDYHARADAFSVRLPRSEGSKIHALMADHGLDFSMPDSTAETAVLFTHEPYAACAFADDATPRALRQLAPLLERIAASWAPESGAHIAVPSDQALHPFQKASVEYALKTGRALIADQPGLGKTCSAIAFANETRAKRVLVICPASIRHQWAFKIGQWTTMRPRPGQIAVHVHKIMHGKSGVAPEAPWTICSYDLARAPAGSVLFAQLADGPIVAPDDPAVEASSRRLLPGEGEFDCAGFVRALPAECPLAIEAPRDADVPHIPAATRAERAVAAMRGL